MRARLTAWAAGCVGAAVAVLVWVGGADPAMALLVGYAGAALAAIGAVLLGRSLAALAATARALPMTATEASLEASGDVALVMGRLEEAHHLILALHEQVEDLQIRNERLTEEAGEEAEALREAYELFNKQAAFLEEHERLAKQHELDVKAVADANVRGANLMMQLEEKNEEIEAAMRQLKEAQEELLQAEKLAVAGQMSGIMAHEVLNPITAGSVRLELALRQAKQTEQVLEKLATIAERVQRDEAKPKDVAMLAKIAPALKKNQTARSEDLIFIERQVARVVRIVDGFRQMSRQRRTIEVVNLSRVVDEVLEDMRDGLAKRKIAIEKDLREASMTADAMELYSIISNMIRNAIQAIDKRRSANGRHIGLQIEPNEKEIVLFVRDSGVGIPRDDWENIFEADFTSKGREGTGYGLNFSRKLARAYHGDIEVVDSAVDGGTTMRLTLGRRVDRRQEQ